MCLFTGEDPKVLRGRNEPSLGAHFSITKKKKLFRRQPRPHLRREI